MEIKTKVNKETIIKKGMKPSEQKRQLRLEAYMDKESKAKSFKEIIKVKKRIANNLPKNSTFSREDIIWMYQDLQDKYRKFEEQIKSTTTLKNFKGKGDLKIIQHPKFFEVIDPRKIENEDGSIKIEHIKHEIYIEDVARVIKAVMKLDLNVKYKTREFARIWAIVNNIEENEDGRKLFGSSKIDFNYANISGCRKTYFPFYYSLKILQDKELIKYAKSGQIKKIKDNISIQTELNDLYNYKEILNQEV